MFSNNSLNHILTKSIIAFSPSLKLREDRQPKRFDFGRNFLKAFVVTHPSSSTNNVPPSRKNASMMLPLRRMVEETIALFHRNIKNEPCQTQATIVQTIICFCLNSRGFLNSWLLQRTRKVYRRYIEKLCIRVIMNGRGMLLSNDGIYRFGFASAPSTNSIFGWKRLPSPAPSFDPRFGSRSGTC